MTKILLRLTLLSFFMAGIWVSTAQTAGNLSGRITTRAGAAVPNATVIVTNVNTGAVQRVLTTTDGSFTLAGLPSGTYRVEVESAGFRRTAQQNVNLMPGTPSDVIIVIEPGEATSTVMAEAHTLMLQDESGEVGKGFGNRLVSDLPIVDRNYQELIGLLPGITPPVAPWPLTADPQRNRTWNTNGLPYWANNRMIDGMQNLEPVHGGAIHATPEDNIRQMNVITSTHDARYGRVGGSFVNVNTPAGTNEFHGNLFYLHGMDRWRARNYFNPEPDPKAHYRWNQFGGNVGGRIIPDRLFFFGGLESNLLREENARVLSVPTPAMRAGDFSTVPGLTLFDPRTGNQFGGGRATFAGNMIPAGRINPVSQAMINQLPLPNQPGLLNNYTDLTFQRQNMHRAIGRLDFYVTENTNLFLRESYSRAQVTDFGVPRANLAGTAGTGFGAFGAGADTRLRAHNAAISAAHRFSPTLTMDAGFGYTRYMLQSWALNPGDPAAFGFGNVAEGAGFPNINIAGMGLALGPDPNLPRRNVDNNYNIMSNWGWTRGSHNLRFGINLYQVRMYGYRDLAFGQNAGFQFGPGATASPTGEGLGQFGEFANAFAGFLLGAPTQVGADFGISNPYLLSTEYSGYIADTWRVTPRLTLSMGLRYEAFSPLSARQADRDGINIFNPELNQLQPVGTGNLDARGNMPFARTSWRNFAPRFGFAYRFGDRTVLRGGYAVSHFRPPFSWLSQALIPGGMGFEQGLQEGFGVQTFGQIPTAPQSGNFAANRQFAFMRDDTRTPYVQSYNFQIQHDFGAGTMLDVGYIGNLGRHLPSTQNLNAALPGTGLAGMPMFQQFGRTAGTFEMGTGLNSNFNSLQANLSKRFTDTLSLMGSYTWSRAMDFGQGIMPFQNNFDRAANYGPADWDRRQMFTLSHVWQPFGSGRRAGWVGSLLAGWELTGILRAVTGTPLTVTGDPTLAMSPGNLPRANVTGVGTETRIIPEPTIWGYWVGVPYRFPIFEFQQPAPGTLGNLGRNAVYGDGFVNYDLAVAKSFAIAEQNRLEFRGEAFNLTNTPHFATPVLNVNSPLFGQAFSTMPGLNQRTIRIGARYQF